MFIKTLKSWTNYDLTNLVNELNIKDFKRALIRDTLPNKINDKLHNKFYKTQSQTILNLFKNCERKTFRNPLTFRLKNLLG